MRGDREKQSLNLVVDLIKQQLGDVNITESSDHFANYDLYSKVNGIDFFIEVKERMNKYVELNNFIKYSELGWQCEDVKWNFLTGKYSRYINVFRVCGEIIIMTWNINEITRVQMSLSCPGTTSGFGTKDKRIKPSMLLTPKQGIVYIYNSISKKYESILWDDLVIKLKNK